MDNPVDHVIDLGLVNYVRHPSNSNYIVFRIQDEARAMSFETALKEQEIWYEKETEPKGKRLFHLFGIHKNDFKKVEQINYHVESKHKKPLIPTKGLRYTVVILGMGMLLLAIIGYCKQQEKLRLYNNNDASNHSSNL
jgi:hypothetical protein